MMVDEFIEAADLVGHGPTLAALHDVYSLRWEDDDEHAVHPGEFLRAHLAPADDARDAIASVVGGLLDRCEWITDDWPA